MARTSGMTVIATTFLHKIPDQRDDFSKKKVMRTKRMATAVDEPKEESDEASARGLKDNSRAAPADGETSST